MSERDLERIAELSRRLEELCEEGEQIRARIRQIAQQMAEYPSHPGPAALPQTSVLPSGILTPAPGATDQNQDT